MTAVVVVMVKVKRRAVAERPRSRVVGKAGFLRGRRVERGVEASWGSQSSRFLELMGDRNVDCVLW